MINDGPALFLSLVRLGVFTLLLWYWGPVVNALRQHGWLHTSRVLAVVKFRWQLLALFVLIEVFVIGTLPRFLLSLLT